MDQKKPDQLVGKVIHFLSFRARSKTEIGQYLAKHTKDQALIQEVVSRVEDLGLVDDQDFSRQLIKSKINKNWGSQKIYFDLLNKGISKADINQALDKITEQDWIDAATRFIQKKYSSWGKLPKKLQSKKIYSILYSRGFKSQTISAAIDAKLSKE